MANQILITILLLIVVSIHHNIDAVRETGAADVNYDVPKVRHTRSAQPFFSGLIEIWNAIVNIHYLYLSVSACVHRHTVHTF